MRISKGAKERADTTYSPYSLPIFKQFIDEDGVGSYVKVQKGIPRALNKECLKAKRKGKTA
jgi:hypothetical protein